MKSMDQISEELSKLHTLYGAQAWVQYTTGFDLGVSASQQKINDFQKDTQNFKAICSALESSSSSQEEKRKAQILYNSFKNHHQSEKAQKILQQIQDLQNTLMDIINKYRARIEGHEVTSTEIGKILSQNPDRERRKDAYLSRNPLNKILVDAGFIKLIDLRKEFAEACGQESFISLKLEEDELTTDVFANWSQECIKRNHQYQEKIKFLAQNFLGLEKLEPWDTSFLRSKLCSFNQAEVDLTNFFEPVAKTFAKFGFNIRDLNLTFDVFPRKNKSEWGYSFAIESGKDSRILANVTNRFSHFNVLLHETAHGVHYTGLNPNEYSYNLGVSSIVAEGFANYFGDLSYSQEFLNEIFPKETAQKAFTEFKEFKKFMHLENFSLIPLVFFDQQLYLQKIETTDDIQNLQRSVEKEFLGTPKSNEEIPWSTVIHHTSAPIYLHNYFIGDIMCDSMKHVFNRQNPGKNSDSSPLEFGTFWKEKVLAPSGRYSLLDLYEKVCEEKLSIGRYLDGQVFGAS